MIKGRSETLHEHISTEVPAVYTLKSLYPDVHFEKNFVLGYQGNVRIVRLCVEAFWIIKVSN